MKNHASNPEIAPLRAGDIAATARAVKLPSPVAVSAPICRIATFHSSSLEAVVASLPALVALRESFPGARICSWARAGVVPLLENFGAVDEAHARPGGGLSSQAALMARLHAGHFDLALCFSRGSNALMLTWATGASLRAGFVPSHFEAFLTHPVRQDGPLTRGAALELVREVGGRARGQSAREHLNIPTEARARAERLLRGGGIETPFVVVAPAPARRTRARRAEIAARTAHWERAMSEMARAWPLVVTPRARSRKDKRAANSPARPTISHSATSHPAASHPTAAHPIVAGGGKMDVLTLLALLIQARGVVGDDAGALALADLLERPVVWADDLEKLPQQGLHRFGL